MQQEAEVIKVLDSNLVCIRMKRCKGCEHCNACSIEKGSDFFEFDTKDPPDLSTLSLKKIKKKAIVRVEKEIISYVLEKTGWNRSKATKILNISYKTLLYKIKNLEIEPPDSPKE